MNILWSNDAVGRSVYERSSLDLCVIVIGGLFSCMLFDLLSEPETVISDTDGSSIGLRFYRGLWHMSNYIKYKSLIQVILSFSSSSFMMTI
jgi:hypothetical protein